MEKIKILALGDLANNTVRLKKYLKNTEIHLINFPWNTASKILDHQEGVEFFDSIYVKTQIKKINCIKEKFDLCLAISPAGARLAYLCGLNYMIYFVGHDIRCPPFVKNITDPFAGKEPILELNFFERKFYKWVYKNATAVVTTGEEAYSNLIK